MDYQKILKDNFGDVITSVSLEKEPFGAKLSVITIFDQLDPIQKITREITQFLEEKSIYPDDLFIEVLSVGKKLDIDQENINKYIDNDIKLFFNKPVEKEEIMIAKLLEVLEDEVIVQWNQKGRIRKLKINKNNIKQAEKYIKF